MKKFVISMAVVATSAFAMAGGDTEPAAEQIIQTPASDDHGLYLGIAYGTAKLTENLRGHTDYSIYDAQQKIRYDTLMLQAGYKINPYFAVEGRYWRSFGDNGWSWSQSGIDKGQPYSSSESGANGDKLKTWGIFAKPIFPLTEEMDIYGLVGYGYTTFSDDDYGDWLDTNGLQWGFGASYAFSDHVSFFADYVRLVNKDSSSGPSDPMLLGGSYASWTDTAYTLNFGLAYKF